MDGCTKIIQQTLEIIALVSAEGKRESKIKGDVGRKADVC
jgi:hypothetical protein